MSIATATARSAEVRSARKLVKQQLSDGRLTVVDVLLNPSEFVTGMRIEDILVAQPRFGHERVWKLCVTARVSPYKAVGSLSGAEHRRLLNALGWTPSRGRRPDPATAERMRDLGEQALEVIRRRYAEPLTRKALAEELGWGTGSLYRALHEVGTTFDEALRRTRMAAAAVLLRRGDGLTATEVARRVGLSEAGLHLSFRRYYGMRPGEYRAQHAQDRREA